MWAWSASLWWRSTCTSRPRSSHLPCTSGRAPGTSSTSGATRSSTEVRGQLQSHGVTSHSTTFGLCTSIISCSYLWSRLLWSFGKLRRPYSSTWLPHLQLWLAQGSSACSDCFKLLLLRGWKKMNVPFPYRSGNRSRCASIGSSRWIS